MKGYEDGTDSTKSEELHYLTSLCKLLVGMILHWGL